MHIVRTIVWVLLLVGLLVFSFANWDPTVTLRIWPGLVVDTKTPIIVTIAFLLGLVPMWLYFRGVKWQMNRRIHSLEQAARYMLPTAVAADPSAVSEAPLAVDAERPIETRPPLA